VTVHQGRRGPCSSTVLGRSYRFHLSGVRPTRRLQGTRHLSFCSPVFSALSRLEDHLSLGTGISRPTGKAPPPLLTHAPPGKQSQDEGISKEILQDPWKTQFWGLLAKVEHGMSCLN